MLNDGKKVWVQGRPFPCRGGAIIHFPDEPDDRNERGKRSGPRGAEDRQSLEWFQGAEALWGVAAWKSPGPPRWGPPWPGE